LTRQIRERFAAAGFAPPVDPQAFIKRVGGQAGGPAGAK